MFTENNYKLIVPVEELGIYMKIFEKLIAFCMCMFVFKVSHFTTFIKLKIWQRKEILTSRLF